MTRHMLVVHPQIFFEPLFIGVTTVIPCGPIVLDQYTVSVSNNNSKFYLKMYSYNRQLASHLSL